MFQYLVIAGAAAELIGILFYVRDTIRGNTQPNRVSWLMWAVASLIGTAASLSAGIRWAVLPVFMAGFGPLLVLTASFVNPKAYWKLEIFDYLCGTFSILALVLWAITREPLVAILFAILSDGFAAIPTLIKCWQHPETESAGPYITGFFNVLTSFFAMKAFDLTNLALPTYFVIINLILAIAVYKKQIINIFSK